MSTHPYPPQIIRAQHLRKAIDVLNTLSLASSEMLTAYLQPTSIAARSSPAADPLPKSSSADAYTSQPELQQLTTKMEDLQAALSALESSSAKVETAAHIGSFDTDLLRRDRDELQKVALEKRSKLKMVLEECYTLQMMIGELTAADPWVEP
ncbi:hypothetical protein HDV05_007659 [Chytridiales sp. JEL 0842]|nr:hypothetical protein HDV05_007659 [Chytridiales sp. JEL 0842]